MRNQADAPPGSRVSLLAKGNDTVAIVYALGTVVFAHFVPLDLPDKPVILPRKA